MEELEFGEIGYAVIDVEALCLGPVFRVVEQVAFVLISASMFTTFFVLILQLLI